MRVDDEVSRGVKVRLPESGALEAVLKHDWDTAVDLCNTSKDTGGVVGNPLSTLVGETSRSTEAGEVVRGLVNGGESPGGQVSTGLDEVKNGIDGVVGVVEVGGVVEEVVVHKSLTDVEVVDTTRERVKANNNVHAIGVDGVVGDGLEVLLLVTVVESRSGDLNPCRISCWDSEGVHADGGKLVNSRSVEEGGIAGFKSGAALVAEGLAESPFVRSGGGVGDAGPPDRVVSLLLLEPSAKVGSICLEGVPVDETASSSGLSGGSRAGSSSCRADDPGGSGGLLAGTSIGGAGETIRVRDGVLVTVAVGSLVGSI